jgi:hypothetical protein
MYDLWFTIGSAILDPTVIDAVTAANPRFDLLTERDLVEEGPATILRNKTTAGLLEPAATTAVRNAIAAKLKNGPVPPPPVSIFAAGKVCQLLTIPQVGYRQALTLANQAIVAVAGHIASPSAGLIAMLGLCIIDPTFTGLVLTPANDTSGVLPQAADEFRLSRQEWDIVNQYVNRPEFLRASHRLFNDPLNAAFDPWQNCCSEQYVFWVGKNERAII